MVESKVRLILEKNIFINNSVADAWQASIYAITTR